MTGNEDEFFGDAQNLGLTPEEREGARDEIMAYSKENPVREEHTDRHTERMEEKPLEKFFALARSVSMSEQERAEVQSVVRTYAAAHPVRAIKGFSWIFECIRHPFHWRTFPVTAFMVIFLVSSGGFAAYAAEDTLPGDFLYPVKVNVSEPLRGYMRFSPHERAKWNLVLMDRRLNEATALLASGKLDEKKRAKLSEKLNRHIAHMQSRIDRFTESQDDASAFDLIERMESALEAHEVVLDGLANGHIAPDAVRTLLSEVATMKQFVKGRRKGIHKRFESKPSRDLQQAAEQTITNASQEVENLRDSIEQNGIAEKTVSKAERRLLMAEVKLADAREKWDAQQYREAFQLSQQARRIALVLGVHLRAHKKYRFNLPEDESLLLQEEPVRDEESEKEESDEEEEEPEEGEAKEAEEAEEDIDEDEEEDEDDEEEEDEEKEEELEEELEGLDPETREAKMAAFHSKRTAYKAATKLREKLNEHHNAVIREKLNEASDTFGRAERTLQKGSFDEAKKLFDRATRIARDAFIVLDVLIQESASEEPPSVAPDGAMEGKEEENDDDEETHEAVSEEDISEILDIFEKRRVPLEGNIMRGSPRRWHPQ